jgi:ubiquinone/menaquinone biosynthesis C-methylase UbiE
MVGSIYNLPFENNSMDIVLCSEVLEHLEKPEKGLRELLRAARHSVVLSVPNEPFFRMGNMLAFKNVSRLGDPPDHIQHWSAGGFVKWVKKNADGFYCCQKSFPWTIVVIRK